MTTKSDGKTTFWGIKWITRSSPSLPFKFSTLLLVFVLSDLILVTLATSSTASRRPSTGGGMTLSKSPANKAKIVDTLESEDDDDDADLFNASDHNQVFNNSLADGAGAGGETYWREVKAIIGGVLGFWGGVGSLGTLFLVIVLSQRYCCKKGDEDKDGDG